MTDGNTITVRLGIFIPGRTATPTNLRTPAAAGLLHLAEAGEPRT